jgi:DNA-binding MarR family transcriptional regulator
MSSDKRGDLRQEVGRQVRAFQTAVDALDEAVAVRLGVNRTDLRCLDVLLQLGEATPGRLGAAVGLTTGSVTVMLDRLEELGLLGRSRDAHDRRKVIVRPSARAARLGQQLYGPLAQAGERDLSRYGVTELEVIIDFLRRSRALQEEHLGRLRRTQPAASRPRGRRR